MMDILMLGLLAGGFLLLLAFMNFCDEQIKKV